MSSPTELYLPHDLPYPIQLVSLHARPSDSISRGTRLLTYSFIAFASDLDSDPGDPETRFGTWDAPIDGSLDRWHVRANDIIEAKRAKTRAVVTITEPCKHGVQIGGLCALCGQDMTRYVCARH